MAARAGSTSEGDISSRVDRKTIVLVHDVRASDGNASAVTDVKRVGVVATQGITGRVINSDVSQGQVGGAVDGKDLDGGVLDREAGDGRRDHAVGVEELGFRLAAVAALTVPVIRAIAVQSRAGALDGNVCARDGDERTGPFFVAEGGGAFEDDLHAY